MWEHGSTTKQAFPFGPASIYPIWKPPSTGLVSLLRHSGFELKEKEEQRGKRQKKMEKRISNDENKKKKKKYRKDDVKEKMPIRI